MILELLFNIIFLLLSGLIDILPSFGGAVIGSLDGFIDLLSYGNLILPLSVIGSIFSIWLTFHFVRLMIFFVKWILSFIP
jgi:hypothetical protein